ncbi:hypothetical protein EYB26_009214 [Talaromyces marneffei]|uniref:uncharacterized protein n=1 Tax=Talaromyces marneffei TaxID=37727 RepID=UPI0012A9098A|nr:uncharacterized protein EYB26_009214 [Talaromyces marneffei]QGA21503.1 hypothetical protein EYB26_009214 [Talaromyces marneffei]
MDPLSVTASVIAVIQIASVVSTHCMHYIKSARNTKSLILRLIQELGGLQIVLRTLEDLTQRGTHVLQNGEDEDAEEESYLLPTLHKLCQLEYVFEECLRKLEQLERDIVPSSQVSLTKKESFFRALHWPLKEAYMRNIMDDINHYIALFSLALTLDETDNMLEIREKTFETHSMVKLLQSQKEEESRREQGERIVKWLAAPDSSVDHTHALRLKTKNTGTWLIQDKKYKDWKDNSGSLLWIYGIAGCGKTILTSTIVEDLLKSTELDMSLAVAYFYFKGDDKDKRTLSGMLRSLLKQLFNHGKRTSDVLPEIFGNGNQQPSSEQLLSSLGNISREFNDVFFVLDALDECEELETIFDVLEEMEKWTESKVHLVFTSRETKDIKEFVDGLEMNKSMIRLSAALVKQDIRMYIRDRLRTDRNLKRWRSHPKVQEEIEDSLVENSDGMFQWVMFQLISLVNCRKPQELRQALTTMPKGLNDTYAQILSRISDNDYEVAIRILHWLLFSARPLYIEELAELAAMDMNAEPFEEIECLWDPADVLNICPNLLTTIEEHPEDSEKEPRLLVRLAHISIREYLLSSEIVKGSAARYHIEKPSAHASITDCCLMYLRLVKDTIPEAAENLPLAIYAAKNWLFHYEQVPETATETHALALDFFLHRQNTYFKWIAYFSSATPPHFHGDLIGPIPLSPLEVASTYSLVTLLKMMLDSDDIDTKNEFILKKALRAAYLGLFWAQNKVATVRLLLQHGADFTGDAKFVTTLHAASYFGFDEIVEEELDEGSDINNVCGDYVTALQAAVVGRHDRQFFQMSKHSWPSGWRRPGYTLEKTDPSTVRLLLSRGADPKLCGGKDGSGLLVACFNGDLPCVRLLLEHGADPNFGRGPESRYRQSCLAAASISGDIRIIHLLLDHGAYTNNRAALSAATETNDPDILRLLLDKGIDPNLERVMDETPLQVASFNSNHKAAELLIQYGAKTDIGGGRFGFPLQSACASYGSVEVVKVLLSNGADVNQRGGAFGTALHTAAFYGDLEMAQYLIDHGGNIHAKGVMFDSVLRHAIQNGHTDIFIALFKEGADMDTPGGRYGDTLRQMLATAPVEKDEIWLRTFEDTRPQFSSESLCAIVRKGETWQDIDNIVIDDRGSVTGVEASQWDCVLPH